MTQNFLFLLEIVIKDKVIIFH